MHKEKRMKASKLIGIMAGAALAISSAASPAAESGGRVDFGSFTPPESGGQFVEINVGATLINMAVNLIKREEPDVAHVISGLRSIRVNVIGLDQGNKADIRSRAQKLGRDLAEKGWERVVAAHEKGQEVGVYLKTRAQDVVQGLTVVVLEAEKQAVFINVDGDIKPEQLAMLGEHMNLEPLQNVPGVNPQGHKAEAEAENNEAK